MASDAAGGDHPPRQEDGAAGARVRHFDIVRLVERVHRRYLDVLRSELIRLGVHDVGPAQVMLLFTIGDDEISVRDLLERGNYLGSNASYNLKQVLEGGYIERIASPRDRRSVRIHLTERGRALCATIREVDAHFHADAFGEVDPGDLETTYRVLRRLELSWTTAMRAPLHGPSGL